MILEGTTVERYKEVLRCRNSVKLTEEMFNMISEQKALCWWCEVWYEDGGHEVVFFDELHGIWCPQKLYYEILNECPDRPLKHWEILAVASPTSEKVYMWEPDPSNAMINW